MGVDMACRWRHNVIWWVSRETKQREREREGNVKKLDLNKSAGILNVLTTTRVTPKIVGGKPAKAGKWPWMTALTYHGCSAAECQFCGGALIAPRWVLTAAHCAAAEGDNPPIEVFLGATKLTGKGETIMVEEIIIHEGFDPNSLDNDLALLRLAKPSKQPVIPVIPSGDPAGLIEPGREGTIIGWGATSEGGEGSKNLLEVTLPIIPNKQAQDAFKKFKSKVTQNMFAAGVPEGGKDSCQGDSGGPFVVCDDNGVWVLAGVTSWGVGCARPGLPGIYTRLARYWDWIQERIGKG